MNKPHKHADVIRAWADGKKIEYLAPWNDSWFETSHPTWVNDLEYRIKPEPLEWQAEREAFARGEKIEYRPKARPLGADGWVQCAHPIWVSSDVGEYRIAPKKWVKEREAFARGGRVEASIDGGKTWVRQGAPVHYNFDCVGHLFRIPHKWQREIDAFGRGELVEWRSTSKQHADMEWQPIPRGYIKRPGEVEIIFNEPTNEFRIKPKTKTCTLRVALMQNTSSSAPFTRTVVSQAESEAVELMLGFKRWLCGWQEVEVEEGLKCDQDSPRPAKMGLPVGSMGDRACEADRILRDSLASASCQADQKIILAQAMADAVVYGAGSVAIGWGADFAKPGGDKTAICGVGHKNGCLYLRHVHINK